MAVRPADELPGYRDPKPMVFCGLYPVDGDERANPSEAPERRTHFNDFVVHLRNRELGRSGVRFSFGDLGLLHMETCQRPERSAAMTSLSLVVDRTQRRIPTSNWSTAAPRSSTTLPRCRRPNEIAYSYRRAVRQRHYRVAFAFHRGGARKGRCQQRRCEMTRMEYLGGARAGSSGSVPPLAETSAGPLRPAEVANAGVASPTRADHGYWRRTAQAVRCAAQQRRGRRSQTIAPRQGGSRLRPSHDREVSAASFRSSRSTYPSAGSVAVGGRIIACDGEGEAQRRDRGVTGRHHPQAQLLERQKEGKKRMAADRARRGSL